MQKKQSDKAAKAEIMVYVVSFYDLSKVTEAFNLIKISDKAFNYPFGYKKIKLVGPFRHNSGYLVYATVNSTPDAYMRHAALSQEPQLVVVCKAWIEQNCPEKQSYFSNLVETAKRL